MEGLGVWCKILLTRVLPIERCDPLAFGVRGFPQLTHAAIGIWSPRDPVFCRLRIGADSLPFQHHASTTKAAVQEKQSA